MRSRGIIKYGKNGNALVSLCEPCRKPDPKNWALGLTQINSQRIRVNIHILKFDFLSKWHLKPPKRFEIPVKCPYAETFVNRSLNQYLSMSSERWPIRHLPFINVSKWRSHTETLKDLTFYLTKWTIINLHIFYDVDLIHFKTFKLLFIYV